MVRWILPNLQRQLLHQWTYSPSEEDIYIIQNTLTFRNVDSIVNNDTISMNSA